MKASPHRQSAACAAFGITLLALGLLPRPARADCFAPNQCICAPNGTDTLLDAIIRAGSSSDTAVLEVLEVRGAPLEIPEDGIIELPRRSEAVIDGDDVDKRALVYVLDGEITDRVLVDAGGNIECSDARSPFSVDEAAEFALLEWDECTDAVFERDGLDGDCDDTARCAVGGGAPTLSLMVLGFFGLARRRRIARE